MVQGRHRRPFEVLRTPVDVLRWLDCECSDDTSGASTRAEVKDAACCGPHDIEILERDVIPAQVVRSSRVTRNAGVPLASRSPQPSKCASRNADANEPPGNRIFMTMSN